MQLFDKQVIFIFYFLLLPWTAKTAKRDGILAPNNTYTQMTDPEKKGSKPDGLGFDNTNIQISSFSQIFCLVFC